MESNIFSVPHIRLNENLKNDLLAASESIKTELLRSVQLHSTDIVESTHLTRKRLKLLRAFLKLLKECGEKEDLVELNATFRDWGKTLSELRDIHVHRLFILDTITDYSIDIAPPLQQKIADIANRQVERMENRLVVKEEVFKNLERQISGHSSLKTFIESSEVDAESILEGFKNLYRKSHRVFKEAKSSQLSEPFHEWRKRLKDVQYQMSLLQPQHEHLNVSVPKVMQLCETLGKDQDLNNFIYWLDTLELQTQSVKNLIHQLEQNQYELKQQVLVDGNKFYKNSFVCS